jgi:ABC-2 type transport system ATP-binding protein
MDPHGRADLKKILKGLGEQGRTVLVSSHILAEMSEFCTSVGIMEKGRMVVSGRVEAVAAQVMGQAVLQIEVLGSTDAFERILERDRRAGPLTVQGGRPLGAPAPPADHDRIEDRQRRPAAPRQTTRYEFPYHGEAEATADLLATLVQAGVRVVAFGRKKENLEELFLKVGARELS